MGCEKLPILGMAGVGWDSDKGTLCRVSSSPPGPVAVTSPVVKTIPDMDGHGWLVVMHDSTTRGDAAGGKYPPLPQKLKVEVYEVKGGREHFTILEGKLKGKTASVIMKSDGSSNLLSTVPTYLKGAKVVFNRKTKQLWYGSKGPIDAFTQEYDQPGAPLSPIPLGTWGLQLPYEIHPAGASYNKYSRFAGTWFRVTSPASDIYQDRYLHPGTLSHGCATVGMNRLNPGYTAGSTAVKEALEKWTELYELLIVSRRNDTEVGTIEVIE